MAQHLTSDHPARRKKADTFSFSVVTTGERPLTRQLREAQKIANDVPSSQSPPCPLCRCRFSIFRLGSESVGGIRMPLRTVDSCSGVSFGTP